MANMYICYNAIIYFYSDDVILYMIIRETIQYNMHIKIESMYNTLNEKTTTCKYMC